MKGGIYSEEITQAAMCDVAHEVSIQESVMAYEKFLTRVQIGSSYIVIIL